MSEYALLHPQERKRLPVIMASGFFAAMSTALAVYVNSSFLATLVGSARVGLVYGVAYFVTLIVMQQYGSFIERFRNHRAMAMVLLLQISMALLLAANIHVAVSLAAFVFYTVATTVNIVNFDVFLKRLTPSTRTGRVRGLFWTVVNVGFVVSPSITALLLAIDGYTLVYAISALAALPPLIMISVAYRGDTAKIAYKTHENVGQTLRRIARDRNLRGIFAIALLIYVFYSWMVIYTPLYLLEAGFTWAQIGTLFTIMLIPFVVVEYPAGWLADKYLGETEMLTLGFAIMAWSILGLMVVHSFWAVALMLFCSRVGASLVEIMRESYFYKRVSVTDLDLIETFRNTAAFANMLAPIIASCLLLSGAGLHVVFISLSLLMVLATGIPVTMEDTK